MRSEPPPISTREAATVGHAASEPTSRAGRPTEAGRRRRRFLTGRGRLRGSAKWVVAGMIFLPLIVIALKLSGLPIGRFLEEVSSLDEVRRGIGKPIGSILLVPLAAVIVVFFRVTLGIRVLGPFRSFLLAVAFQATGIPLGLFFFAVVLGVTTAVRRPLKAIRLPYFARVSIIMSTVAGTIALTLAVSSLLGIRGLGQVAHFPIVALCLAGDAFAATRIREGWRSAVWRGAVTAAVAVLITLIAGIGGFIDALVRFPELLMLEVGLIILIAEFLGYRLLSSWNPPPVKKRKRKRKKSVTRTAATRPAPDDRAAQVPQTLVTTIGH